MLRWNLKVTSIVKQNYSPRWTNIMNNKIQITIRSTNEPNLDRNFMWSTNFITRHHPLNKMSIHTRNTPSYDQPNQMTNLPLFDLTNSPKWLKCCHLTWKWAFNSPTTWKCMTKRNSQLDSGILKCSSLWIEDN